MSDDDIFAGDVGNRLHRIDRRLRAVVLDAQCRDWVAERPDRLGFARLDQARHEVRRAGRRFNPFPRTDDWTWTLVAVGTWSATALLVLLLAAHPAAPLTVAAAVVAGMVAGHLALMVLFRWRVRRARRSAACVRPDNKRLRTQAPIEAPIDDPFLYADLTRRIEACAATARSLRHEAADDLVHALDWVSAARDELAARARG